MTGQNRPMDYELKSCSWLVDGCKLVILSGDAVAFEVQLTPHQAIGMALDLHAAAMKRLKSAAND
jgi:hypothetical protein